MHKIDCIVEPHYPIKRSILAAAANAALEAAKVKVKSALSVSIVGDRKARQLNKQYRGIDKPTDVLAFPSLEMDKPDRFARPPSKYLYLGDIVISYPQLLQRAAKENTLVDDMAAFLVTHGVLHLLGYDHEKDDEATVMEKLEDQILLSLQTIQPAK